jgi:hypothetical protein
MRVVLVCFCSRAVREQYWFGSIAGVVQGELILTRSSEVMRVNEVAEDRSCKAIEKDPLHLDLNTTLNRIVANLCVRWI